MCKNNTYDIFNLLTPVLLASIVTVTVTTMINMDDRLDRGIHINQKIDNNPHIERLSTCKFPDNPRDGGHINNGNSHPSATLPRTYVILNKNINGLEEEQQVQKIIESIIEKE